MVRLYLEEEHYVLMTGIQNENILLFDPYYWDQPYEQKDILIDREHPKATTVLFRLNILIRKTKKQYTPSAGRRKRSGTDIQ